MRLYAVIVALSWGMFSAVAQGEDCPDWTDAKAEKLLNKAANTQKYDANERAEWLRQAIERDEECMACRMALGNLLFKRAKRSGQSFNEARSVLNGLTSACPDYHADAWYALGAMAYADQYYADAEGYFERYLNFSSDGDGLTRLGRRYDRQAEEVREVLPIIAFELDFSARVGTFEPLIVSGVSSREDEYLPALAADASILFYTRKGMRRAKGDAVSHAVELFSWSHAMDSSEAALPLDGSGEEGEFSMGEALEHPFNRGVHYGGATISVDNRELLIAAQAPTTEFPDNIDLFTSRYEVLDRDEDGRFIYLWSRLVPLSFCQKDRWEAQPSLSADGTQLYFAAVGAATTADAEGNPTMDILVSTKDSLGHWSTPTALPSPINTTSQDKAPFIHPDGRTLYFASNRQPGGGGFDLWFSQRDSTGSWSTPKNFGAPVNTSGDEHGLVVTTDGATAYFSSRRPGTQGLDILSFPVPKSLQPEDVRLVKGTLLDKNGKPPSGARISLEYASSLPPQEIDLNTDDGTFAAVYRALPGEDVLLVVEGENLAFDAAVVYEASSERVESAMSRTKPAIASLERAPLPSLGVNHVALLARPQSTGEPLELRNIVFATSSAQVDRQSQLLIQAFATYLMKHSSFDIEIHGHTDDRGNPAENLELSKLRANAVATLLEQAGVSHNRIVAQGFGQSRPVVPNTTATGRAQNRRTEFLLR